MSESSEPKPVTWDDVLALYKKLTNTPPPAKRYLLPDATWSDVIANADREERAILEELRMRQIIIVGGFFNDLLPNGVYLEFDASTILP